jgi:hypothetical protein
LLFLYVGVCKHLERVQQRREVIGGLPDGHRRVDAVDVYVIVRRAAAAIEAGLSGLAPTGPAARQARYRRAP